MIWRVALCVFFIAIGIKTLQQVTSDYKYSTESPMAEQFGVVAGTALLCLLALKLKKKGKDSILTHSRLSQHVYSCRILAGKQTPIE